MQGAHPASPQAAGAAFVIDPRPQAVWHLAKLDEVD